MGHLSKLLPLVNLKGSKTSQENELFTKESIRMGDILLFSTAKNKSKVGPFPNLIVISILSYMTEFVTLTFN